MDNEKRNNLFDDDMLVDVDINEKTSTDSDKNKALDEVQSGDIFDKINDSANNESRLNQEDKKESKKELRKRNKKEKKNKEKILYTPEQLEDLEKQRKRKKRKRRLISLALFLVFTLSATGSIYFLNNKIGQNEANKEILYSKYKEVFTDEEYSEIIKDLPKKKYDEISELYKTIPDGTAKMQFKNWQETLTEQFNNQEKAKSSLSNLYDTSNNYISETVDDKQISETESALKLKFNSEYQNELLKEFETVKGQYNLMSESVKAVNSLFNDKKEVNDLTLAQLENIKAKIDKNPNTSLKAKQTTQYDSAYKQWSEREEKRKAEEEKLEQERIEQERIAQEKSLEEARRQAEYEAQLEAEREKVRQEEAKKQAEEQARQDEINRQNEITRQSEEAEAQRKAQEEEQKRKEQEAQNNANNTTSSSTTSSSN